MHANGFSEPANLLDILIPQIFFRKTTIGFDQAPGKIGRSIAHETFDLVKHRSYLLARQAGVVKEGNKAMNGLLKIDIVLPKGIVCIDQQMVSHHLSGPSSLSCLRHCLFSLPPANRSRGCPDHQFERNCDLCGNVTLFQHPQQQ